MSVDPYRAFAPDGNLNTTDPDARRMKVGRDFIPASPSVAEVTAIGAER